MLSSVLSNNRFSTTISHSLGDSFLYLASQEIDTIICSDRVENLDFNAIFLRVKEKKFLINTSFCVILPKNVDKEALIIGAEIGVDKFFFQPINESSLINSLLELHLKKSQISLLKSKDFRDYIAHTNNPTCVVRDDVIYFANESFQSIFPEQDTKSAFDSLFDLGNDQTKKADYSRFKLGLFKTLRLKEVKTKSNEWIDLFLFRGDFLGHSVFIAELEKGSIGLEKEHLISFKLSQREKQVANLSSKGLTIKGIAERLNLSPRTVERHRANIMNKTSSQNIIEALGKLKRQA